MSPSIYAEELEWIQRSVSGDHEAFRCLVLSYESQLLKYLFHLLGDWEHARDIAQDTFVAAFYALPRWKPMQLPDRSDNEQLEGNTASYNKRENRPLAPWLYRIATNRALTFLKKQTAYTAIFEPRRREWLQYEEKTTLEEQPGSDRTVEECYITHELLHEALRRLSKEDATYLVLRFVLGEPYSAIAEQCGLSKEAVRKRIARGVIALRAAYRALDMEELI